MAELTKPTPAQTSSCCEPDAQSDCCEAADKDACCASTASGGSCGCAAGERSAPTGDTRETVRERYAAAARQAAGAGTSCCETGFDAADTGTQTFGAALDGEEAVDAPQAAVNRRWAAAFRPPWPTCTRARRCSISARAPAPAC